MHSNHDLVVERRANEELADFLRPIGPAGVFPRYVATQARERLSLTCTRDGRVVGTIIGGAECGLYQAYAYWLIAESDDVAAALCRSLRDADAPGRADRFWLEARPEQAEIVALALRQPVWTRDCLYVAHRPIADFGDVRVERLVAQKLYALSIAPELGPILGVLDDWTDEAALYGVVDGNDLIAVAEASVRDDHHAAIQQVFTVSSHRGRGIARAIVATVTNDLLARGLRPVYVVDENNTASVHLVERLGFELLERWAFFEVDRYD
jgi:ribosomal protein S18 acetylase RimI-like enzyme